MPTIERKLREAAKARGEYVKPSGPRKVLIGVPPKLLAEFDEILAHYEQTRSEVIRDLIRKYVELIRKSPKL